MPSNPYITQTLGILAEKKWNPSLFEIHLRSELESLLDKNTLDLNDIERRIDGIRQELIAHPENIASTGNVYVLPIEPTGLQRVLSKLLDLAVELKVKELKALGFVHFLKNIALPNMPDHKKLSPEELALLEENAPDLDRESEELENTYRLYIESQYRFSLLIGNAKWNSFTTNDRERYKTLLILPSHLDVTKLEECLGKEITDLVCGELFINKKHFSQTSLLDLRKDCYSRPDCRKASQDSLVFYDAEKENTKFDMHMMILGLTRCEGIIMKDVDRNRYWALNVQPKAMGSCELEKEILYEAHLSKSLTVDMIVININGEHNTIMSYLRQKGVTVRKTTNINLDRCIDIFFSPGRNEIKIYKHKEKSFDEFSTVFKAIYEATTTLTPNEPSFS